MQALIKGNLNAGLFQKVGDYTVGGYLQIPGHSDFNLGTLTNFTIGLWMKVGNTWPMSCIEYFESDNNYWEVNVNGMPNAIGFSVAKGSNIVSMAGGDISDGAWHYYTVVKKGNEYGLYLDGQQIDYANTATPWSLSGTLNMGLNVVRGAWTIPSNLFKGNMDCIMISHGNVFSASPNIGKTDVITVPTAYPVLNVNTKLYLNARDHRYLSDGIVDLSTSAHKIYNNGVVASGVGPYGNLSFLWNGFNSTGTTGGETSISVDGINGDADSEILIEAISRGDTLGMNPGIRLNDDSGTNYHENRLLIYGAGVGSLQSSPYAGGTSFPSVNLNAALTTVGYARLLLNAKSGKVRTGTMICNGFGGVGAPHISCLNGAAYSGTGIIKKVSAVVLGAGKLTGGSSLKVYVRRLK